MSPPSPEDDDFRSHRDLPRYRQYESWFRDVAFQMNRIRRLDPEGLPQVRDRLHEAEGEEKYALAISLARLGDDRVCALLCDALRGSSHGRFRVFAAGGIRQLAEKRVLTIEQEADLRACAQEGLSDTYVANDGRMRVRYASKVALAQLGVEHVEVDW